MAGWTDSGSSRGRGGGGFANRGGGHNNMNTRWRERRPAQLQHQHQQPQHQHQHQHQHQQHQQQHQQHQQQHQQHRYRPVNRNDQFSQHPHHSPVEELNHHGGQGDFSASTRCPHPTRQPQARPTFTDHKSPAPAANVNANANEPDDKAGRNAANFECNVCFDMADDPVVTKCGHLFCWECLYQWLHVHSHHRECPVCKGQVADDAIIPIYGRGGSAASVHAAPPRPTGARVESSRQQQQQAAADWHMVDDDEDGNPFDDLHRLFGASILGNAMMGIMPDDHMITDVYGEYSSPYHHNDFDEIHDFEIMGSPVLASAGASSSWRHGHHTAFSDDMTMDAFFDNTAYHEPGFAYRGGHRQRGRARGAASADHSSIADMSSWVMGGSSSASYRDTGAGGPHHINNTGGSSRPNGGWTERRGRSNRNSNSGGGGRGNSRRQGTNYN